MPEITLESTFAEVLRVYPGAQNALQRFLYSPHLALRLDETLGQLLARHHVLDFKRVMEALRRSKELTDRLLVEPKEAARQLKSEWPPVVIDMRERDDFLAARMPEARHLDHDLNHEMTHDWPKDRSILLVCEQGDHSLDAAGFFLDQGFHGVRALRGGMRGWIEEVDPSFPHRGDGPVRLTSRREVAIFFTPRPVGTAFFASADDAVGSPLAERLFALGDVERVGVSGDMVRVARKTFHDWHLVAPRIQAALADAPSVSPEAQARMRPSAEVVRGIQLLLETQINPAIASHGGAIRLAAWRDFVADLEMTGGCQGCGSARMTMQKGVEVMLQEHVPEVLEVRDLTDHAAGLNPYYR